MEKQQKSAKFFFSIQLKVGIMIVVIVLFGLVTGLSSVRGLNQIEMISNHIIKEDAPVLRSIQEIFMSMSTGRLATEQALDISDYSRLDEIASLEATFEDSWRKTKAFMAALTWGSETEAFRKSADGTNYKTWIDIGESGVLIVHKSEEVGTQFIGQANIYYNGFVKKTTSALESHRESLRLGNEGERVASLEMEKQSKVFIAEARRFYILAMENLDRIVVAANISTDQKNEELISTEKGTRSKIIIILIASFLTSFILSFLFSYRAIIRPLKKLTVVAREYAAGKLDARVKLNTNDEISELAMAFNKMAEYLVGYTTKLEDEVAKRTVELNKKVYELERTNQLMVNRELKMIELKKKIIELEKKEE